MEGSVLDAAIANNVVAKRGSWLSFESAQIARVQSPPPSSCATTPRSSTGSSPKIKGAAPVAIGEKGKDEKVE